MKIEVFHWNDDKPHRCPSCHRVVNWEGGKMSRWRLHQCPYCRLLFARWARRQFTIYDRRCPICGQTKGQGHYKGRAEHCARRLAEHAARGHAEWN